MPVIEDGTYRLPFPCKSAEHAGWEQRQVTQTNGRGGMETVELTVERLLFGEHDQLACQDMGVHPPHRL